jgi:hypothetical protein
MAYKLENFLIQVSGTYRLLKIKDNSGIIKYTIDGFSITSLRAINNIVKIVTKSNTIDLDFSTTNEARIALSRIQAQIDLLKEKTPIFIDKKISNYVSNITQGFRYNGTSSTPLQVPSIGDIVLLYTQTELGYTPGQSILAYNTLIDNFFNEDYVYEPTISFQGQVDGYDASNGLLSVLIDNSVGYGLTNSQNQIATYSFWYLNLIGQIGPQGAAGSGIGTGTGPQGNTGPQGFQGYTGPQGFQGLADRYSATSSTPLQIPEAGYVANLVTQTSLAYTPGQSVLVYNTLAENYMDDEYVEEDSSILFIGQIDNYIPSTGDLQLVVSSSVGFGLTDSNNETATYSFWYINITGQTGQDGQGVGMTASFTELTVTGPTNIQQVIEVLTTATSGPGLLISPTASTFNLNFDDGSIFYIEPEGENFVANYLNFPTTDNRIISTTIIISQTASAYIPNVVAVDGDIIPISWANSSLPSGNANQTDIVGFSFMRIGATWSKVFGQLSTFATI